MSSTTNPVHRLFRIDAAHHGDLSKTKLDMEANLEVICIGLSRTGTTSLHAALTTLGFGPCHQGIDLFRSMPRNEQFIDLYSKVLDGTWKAGEAALSQRLRELMKGYKSVTDMPVFPLTEEVYAAYPEAKYILTTRPGGAEAWWKSMQVLMWHLRRDWWRTLFRVSILPVYFIRRSDDCVQLIREVWERRFGAIGPGIYEKHNESVKKLVPHEKLLVYDVREGWEPLCKFLEVEVPKEAFPNLNDAESMAAIYTGMMMFGLAAWAVYGAGAAGLAYLAFSPESARGLLQRIVGEAGRLGSRMGL